MHTRNSILIRAPLFQIFSTASDLVHWPDFLSHYRENKFLSPMPWGGIVKMRARRTGLPIEWISVYQIDTDSQQLQFEHLKPLTRGMKVIWSFEETAEGVWVHIDHDFVLDWPLVGGFIAQVVVGWFIVDHIATRTLRGLKKKMEAA
jgi:ribosome-associated toxin RatA of RatAB toxin-antitoxin module